MKKDTATREKILMAARAVFVEKGQEGARMQEISERAGVNKALLHYYFTSKDNLYREIFTDAFNDLLDNFYMLTQLDLSLKEQLEQFIEKHFDFLARNQDLVRLIAREATRANSLLNDFLPKLISLKASNLRNNIFNSFNEAIRKGEIDACDPSQVMINIIGMNAFYFVAKPIVDSIFPEVTENQAEFLEQRKLVIKKMALNGIFKSR
ncbi:TetR/AcrR family transcriptional regulator [candidate division KSB1 bacterium]|nr:TetR/AcrR family transcriptional regulator [candidate division KSB1 bacterium]